MELKAKKAQPADFGQLLTYIGWFQSNQEESTSIRGILIAPEFDTRTIYAARTTNNVKLLKYRVQFTFDHVAL